MPNTALNRTTQVLLTNKSGGNLVYGDVVVLDNTNANGFTTTTTGALGSRGIGVILEPNGIANNASGMVAVGGWAPKCNLNTAATVGQFIQTHTVAGQGTPHSSPQAEGDFAVALTASATPPICLFGSPNGPTSGTGTVTHSAGNLTANQLVYGNGTADIKVVAATNGQIPIGKTSDGTAALATITAGVGITVTNAANSVTIAGTGWARLAQVVTSGSQATADFTSIPSGYTSLKLLGDSQDTLAGTGRSTVRVYLNNDTTSGNYTVTQRHFAQNGSVTSTTLAASAIGVQVGLQPNAGSTSQAGQFEMTIQNYTGTTFHKIIQSFCGSNDDTVNGTIQQSVARWKSTAAITRVTVATDGTAFLDGSVFTLYGVY